MEPKGAYIITRQDIFYGLQSHMNQSETTPPIPASLLLTDDKFAVRKNSVLLNVLLISFFPVKLVLFSSFY